MARLQGNEDRTLERRRALLIGLALLCCYGYFFYLGGNWNVESRSAQVFALAEQGSLAIDGYPLLPVGGGDAARYGGHYYSDKQIGPSLVAVPAYWLARRAISTAGANFRTSVYLALRVANVLANAIPSALLGALLYLFLAELGLGSPLRVWTVFAYGLGTLALPYSTALFGHQFAAVCTAGSFMLLWRQRHGWSARRAAAAGALSGLGAISDFMALVIAVFLGLYAIRMALEQRESERLGVARAVRRVAAFALVAGLVVSLQLAANWRTFGSPLEFPHTHHAQASFQERHAAGFFGIHRPQAEALYQLTIGPYRGLFYGSPVLLLALPGVFLLGRKRRAEAVVIGAAWLSVLVLHSGYADWPAGTAYGPRYQIAAVPLLMLAAAEAAKRSSFILKTLAVISIGFTLSVCAQNPFGIPTDVGNPLAAGLANLLAGNLQYGNLGLLVAIPGIVSLLPLAAVEVGFLYALARLGRRRK